MIENLEGCLNNKPLREICLKQALPLQVVFDILIMNVFVVFMFPNSIT